MDLGAANIQVPDKILIHTSWTNDRSPKDFVLYGSSDNITWTQIDQRSNLSPADYNNTTDADISFSIPAGGTPLSTAPWIKSGTLVYNTSDNIGIGTTNPLEKLEVLGGIKGSKLTSTGETHTQDLYE